MKNYEEPTLTLDSLAGADPIGNSPIPDISLGPDELPILPIG